MGSTRRREARRRAMSKSVQVVTLANLAAANLDADALFLHPDDLYTTSRFEVYLPPDLWRDMGEPAVITVTVEPGDLLNP
jgi:hypothetical protein